MRSRAGTTATLAALALVLGAAAGSSGFGTPRERIDLGKGLRVERLRTGFWVHESQDALAVPANGMIARTREGLLLIDTTWSDALAERLVDWAEKNLADRVVKAIVTHSHPDRAGGIAALKRRGIPVLALDLTIARLRAGPAKPAPDLLMAAAPGAVYASGPEFEVFYPGPGHAPDNLVVWFPKQQILFGGCLVKAETAPDLGNVADADLRSWPAAMEALRARYPSAVTVVPGHGPVGGPQALARTLELLRDQRPSGAP